MTTILQLRLSLLEHLNRTISAREAHTCNKDDDDDELFPGGVFARGFVRCSHYNFKFCLSAGPAKIEEYRKKNPPGERFETLVSRRGAINGARGSESTAYTSWNGDGKFFSSFIAPTWLIRHAFRRRSKIRLD